MAKGFFLNQKLGKRVSRKFRLLKSSLEAQEKNPRQPAQPRRPKKGAARGGKPW
jgi:hypothetical protein